MKKILILSILLSGLLFSLPSCNNDEDDNKPTEMEVDSFNHLTPCLIEIVKDYPRFVLNDTFPDNDDFNLDRIYSLEVDAINYYWLETDGVDETEYILTGECELVCTRGGWIGFDSDCLPEFKNEVWAIAWQR